MSEIETETTQEVETRTFICFKEQPNGDLKRMGELVTEDKYSPSADEFGTKWGSGVYWYFDNKPSYGYTMRAIRVESTTYFSEDYKYGRAED
jgi:hypothetical protein